MRQRQSLFIFGALPLIVCLMVVTQSVLAANSATTVIRANIVGGACDISVPPTVLVSNGEPIPAEEITPTSDFHAAFDLTISGCQGYGLTPAMTVMGDTDSASGKDLFVSPTSTTTGYGILLSTQGNDNFMASENLATDKKIVAQTKTWVNTFANTLNGTLPLKAAVSCGDCTGSDLQGGELNASLTFNFVYN